MIKINQKGFSPMLIIMIVAVVIAAGVIFITLIGTKQNFTPSNQTSSSMPQVTSSPTPSLNPTMEPGKPLDISTWNTYTDSATSLTFRYPLTWKLTEGPKTINTNTDYSYKYLQLSGLEGSITFMSTDVGGGGCDGGYQTITINGFKTLVCDYIPPDESQLEQDETWNQIYIHPVKYFPKTFGGPYNFDLNAVAKLPTAQNRNVILQIIETIKGVQADR